MFNLFRGTKPTSSTFSKIQVDFHSHLIPGVDDGSKSMDESIQLINGLLKLGFKSIITTPHIYFELYPNTSKIILHGLEEVKQALEEQSISVPFHAAAEYFIDEHFEELLANKELLPIYKNLVLVETSFFQAPPNLEDVIFSLRTKNYIPILAHPERYTYFNNNISKYQKLKDLGCQFQLNLLSLTGFYGAQVQKTADLLIKNKLIDYLGTDLHNMNHLEYLTDLAYSRRMKKILDQQKFLNPTIKF